MSRMSVLAKKNENNQKNAKNNYLKNITCRVGGGSSPWPPSVTSLMIY